MRSLAWSVLLVVVSACDPGWGANGRVETLPPGGEASAPLEGADVRIECPGMAPVTATTDAQGEFSVSELGFLEEPCEVVVSRSGFAARRFAVGQVCDYRWRVGARRCNSLKIDVVLDPAG
jgi:hypothetical protein